MKTIPAFLLAAGLVAAGNPAHAQTRVHTGDLSSGGAPALLRMLGAEDIGGQASRQAILTLQQIFPLFPPSFWDEMERGIHVDRVVDKAAGAFDRHLAQEDIQAAIRFLETPAGQRIADALPAIAQETMQAGGTMAIQAGSDALKKLADGTRPD